MSAEPRLRDPSTPLGRRRDGDPTGARAAGPRRLPAAMAARDRGVAAAILLGTVSFVAACFWPGHMSADTLSQIAQARSAEYSNMHAALLVAIWHPFFDLGMGPGWVLTAQLLTFTGGCYLILRTAFTRVRAAAVTAALTISPPVFGMLGFLSRDTWFVALLLATFGITIRAVQASGRQQRVLIALALAAAWLTLATRQNAAGAVVVAVVVLVGLLGRAWLGDSRRPPRLLATGRRRVLAAMAGGVALTLGLMGTQFAANAAIGTSDANPEQQLFAYDLVRMSAQERENLFPPEVLRDRSLATVDLRHDVDNAVVQLFLRPDSPFRFPMPPEADRALRRAWKDAIVEHPLTYLDIRKDLWLRQMTVGYRAVWIYHPQIDANPFGYRIRFPVLNSGARDYVEGFATPLLQGRRLFYTVWVYLLLALAAGMALLVRRRDSLPLMTVGGLGIATLTHQSGVFLGAMGTQYRFEFPVVVIAVLTVAVLIGQRRSAPR